MIYGIHHFISGTVLSPRFSTCAEAHKMCNHDLQCVVLHATTEEDERYFGTEWRCTHCLLPEQCTYCNPAYTDAVIISCPICNEIALTAGRGQSLTWHVDGKCLKCKERT